MHSNVNYNVFFKLIKVHILVNELYKLYMRTSSLINVFLSRFSSVYRRYWN